MMTVDQLADPYASLTNEEYFALHGTLNATRIEQLLEMSSKVEAQAGAVDHIDEASGYFPNEDFLGTRISSLQGIAARLRGQSKAEMDSFIQDLENLQRVVWQTTEEGLLELEKAKDAIWVP